MKCLCVRQYTGSTASFSISLYVCLACGSREGDCREKCVCVLESKEHKGHKFGKRKLDGMWVDFVEDESYSEIPLMMSEEEFLQKVAALPIQWKCGKYIMGELPCGDGHTRSITPIVAIAQEVFGHYIDLGSEDYVGKKILGSRLAWKFRNATWGYSEEGRQQLLVACRL